MNYYSPATRATATKKKYVCDEIYGYPGHYYAVISDTTKHYTEEGATFISEFTHRNKKQVIACLRHDCGCIVPRPAKNRKYITFTGR